MMKSEPRHLAIGVGSFIMLINLIITILVISKNNKNTLKPGII